MSNWKRLLTSGTNHMHTLWTWLPWAKAQRGWTAIISVSIFIFLSRAVVSMFLINIQSWKFVSAVVHTLIRRTPGVLYLQVPVGAFTQLYFRQQLCALCCRHKHSWKKILVARIWCVGILWEVRSLKASMALRWMLRSIKCTRVGCVRSHILAQSYFSVVGGEIRTEWVGFRSLPISAYRIHLHVKATCKFYALIYTLIHELSMYFGERLFELSRLAFFHVIHRLPLGCAPYSPHHWHQSMFVSILVCILMFSITSALGGYHCRHTDLQTPHISMFCNRTLLGYHRYGGWMRQPMSVSSKTVLQSRLRWTISVVVSRPPRLLWGIITCDLFDFPWSW